MVTKKNAFVLNNLTAYYRLSDSHDRWMTFRTRLAKTRGLTLEEVLEGE